jgi:hypothetical protein
MPRTEWGIIKNESKGFIEILITFVGCLVLLELFVSVIRILICGPYKRMNQTTSILFTILFSLTIILYICYSSLVINIFAPKFGGNKNRNNANIISLYCSNSLIISIVLELVPVKNIGILAVIFLIYTRYFGLKIIMGSTRNTLLYAALPDLFILILAFLVYSFGTLLKLVLVS